MTGKDLLALFCSCLLFIGTAYAQTATRSVDIDLEAKTLLERVSDNLNSPDKLKIEFELTVAPPEQEEVIWQGTFYKSGEKWNITTDQHILISDGKSMWNYMPEINEVHITELEPSDNGLLSPDMLLHIYDTEDYAYAILNRFREGAKSLAAVEFKPLASDAAFFKLRLTIDENSAEPHIIESFSRDGTRHLIKVQSLQKNPDLNVNLFAFDPKSYPGVHVEDLRF